MRGGIKHMQKNVLPSVKDLVMDGSYETEGVKEEASGSRTQER